MPYSTAKLWIGQQFKEDDSIKKYPAKRQTKKQWKTFVHNGVMFPEPYKPHNIPIIYEKRSIAMTPDAEEAATLYAKYINTEYVETKIFNKNFWNDWKKILGPDSQIKSLENCDFSEIIKYLEKLKTDKANMSPDEKKEIKQKNDELAEPYKYAYVDDVKQEVGNFRVEPPGLFLGRGLHPKSGKIKKRILPNNITLNLDKSAPIPKLPAFYSTMKWKAIVHDNTSQWIASYTDTISNKIKYFWLGATSNFKTKSDLSKFELARKLKKKIKMIRIENDKNLQNPDRKIRQIATALYFIDKFALRVGNEKGDDAADTVGVTSLRVEHVKLLDDYVVKLDFLGKDSIRYLNKVVVSSDIYYNLQEFIKDKNNGDDLFDMVSSADVNKYLHQFMDGLTAKVFRTYNASNLFQKELNNISKKYDGATVEEILHEFNKANAKIAILCNHQKKPSKKFPEQIEKLDNLIKTAKKKLKDLDDGSPQIAKIKETIKKLQNKKNMKMEQKNISLGTSKINYIDPRITVAFLKKHKIDEHKIFSKTQLNKFKWAFDVDENFEF